MSSSAYLIVEYTNVSLANYMFLVRNYMMTHTREWMEEMGPIDATNDIDAYVLSKDF